MEATLESWWGRLRGTVTVSVSAVWCGPPSIRKHKTHEEAESLELLVSCLVAKAPWVMDGKESR